MPWRRDQGQDRPGPLDELARRMAQLEQRIDEVEDTAAAGAMEPDRVEMLARRLEDLALEAATQDDVLENRLHAARVAADVARIAAELRSEIDHVRAAVAEATVAARRSPVGGAMPDRPGSALDRLDAGRAGSHAGEPADANGDDGSGDVSAGSVVDLQFPASTGDTQPPARYGTTHG